MQLALLMGAAVAVSAFQGPIILRSQGRRRGELLCSAESEFRYYEEWRRTGKQPLRLIPFETARTAVQNLGLTSIDEWEEWVVDNKPGITSTRCWLMPNQPDEAYAASGWQGWDDWLGVMLPYEAARDVVREMGILSQEQWWALVKLEAPKLQRLRVPARPHLKYPREWQGYDTWLGLPETPLTFP